MLLPASAVRAQEVLLTADQALKEIFPEAARTVPEERPLSDSVRQALQQRLGRPILERELRATRVYDTTGAFRGYAVVTEEIGKYRPITFMVGITPALAVRDVTVMVYRESRGGDVKRERFLSQYRGKTARDPVALNRDIINISGATISVRSMNAGVRRVLAEVTAVYAADPERIAAQDEPR
ncbi:MAG TPA: FMN-binding protein [Gemmatimonadaceae bacterium]|nr:FMN-binding protein [Gemmatimonadaceae bacterium]